MDYRPKMESLIARITSTPLCTSILFGTDYLRFCWNGFSEFTEEKVKHSLVDMSRLNVLILNCD